MCIMYGMCSMCYYMEIKEEQSLLVLWGGLR